MRRLNLEDKLRKGLKNDEFEVWFQPKIASATKKVTGMEALVRWRTKDGEVISPAEFIPLAEETGLILQLGAQVLDKALEGFKGFKHPEPLKLAVNLSPLEFTQPNLRDNIVNTLKKHDVPAEQLEIEITETVLLENFENTISKLNSLAEHGVSVAIDDFGTGYSSLSYLKRPAS